MAGLEAASVRSYIQIIFSLEGWQTKPQQFENFLSGTCSYALGFLNINLHFICNINIHLHTYVYKTQETLFLKTFKCGRKLSHFPSGKALKCLSWPDGIPCLSPQMSREGGGGLCLLESQNPSRTAEGLVLPASCRLSRGWTCHG